VIKVSDVMTYPVVTIRGAAPVAEAIQRMLQHRIHTLIVDRQHPQDAYGIVTNLDIINQVIAFGRDPKRVRLGSGPPNVLQPGPRQKTWRLNWPISKK